MKKIISVLLILLLCLAPVSVSANNSSPDATQIMMGDANNDKNVNAADARIVLRVASKLEPADKVSLHNADANGDEKINAADARLILREAAGLSKFIYGFDGNGVPCALNVIRSNKFSIKMTYIDPTTDFGDMTMTIAKNIDDIYMSSSDISKMMGDENSGIDMSQYKNCGMMIIDNLLYILMANDKINGAMPIPDDTLQLFDLSKTDSIEMFDMSLEMITSLLPENIGTASKTTLDGKDVYCYSYEILEQHCLLYVAENGMLMRIDEVTDAGNKTLMIFDDISSDPNDCFALDQYDIIDIFM